MIGSSAGPMSGAEIYDAEIFGALKAIEAAMEKAGNAPTKLLLDNKLVVDALLKGQSYSSQSLVEKFMEKIKNHQNIEIRWIPSHSKILGNEIADRLAKAALRDHPAELSTEDVFLKRSGTKFTFAALNRFIIEHVNEKSEAWWQKNRPKRHEELDLKMKQKSPPELCLLRWAYHRLIASKTGHGDFSGYHERFKHLNADKKCMCGREKRPWHFSECRIALKRWRDIKQEPPPTGRAMLAEGGWKEFYQYLTVTRCYSGTTTEREEASTST